MTDKLPLHPDAAVAEIRSMFEDYFESTGRGDAYRQFSAAVGPILKQEFDTAFKDVFGDLPP